MDESRIKRELIQSFKYFDSLRERLVYNPSKEAQHSYRQEWDLEGSEGWQIEESIEQRELSTVCEAARQLNMSVDDMSVWVAMNRE